MIKVFSMVVKCTLNQSLDFNILKTIDNVILPKKGNAWARIRLSPHNYDVAFYKSGKFIITGVNPSSPIDHITKKILKILDKVNIHTKILNIEIVNMTCLGSISLDTKTLESIIVTIDDSKVSYEPEQFPALIYKNWGATFLLFSSGKVIITGIRDETRAHEVFSNFKNLILNL